MVPYDMLKNVLEYIERNLAEDCDIAAIARTFSISQVHLRRIFKIAFGVSLSGYIRSRRLSSSLELLLNKNMTVLDVANECGYSYEQSYIRAFKKEFGILPGSYIKSCQGVAVTPPIEIQ